jgi:hypothetical protein
MKNPHRIVFVIIQVTMSGIGQPDSGQNDSGFKSEGVAMGK